jgi:hypothetical protein
MYIYIINVFILFIFAFVHFIWPTNAHFPIIACKPICKVNTSNTTTRLLIVQLLIRYILFLFLFFLILLLFCLLLLLLLLLLLFYYFVLFSKNKNNNFSITVLPCSNHLSLGNNPIYSFYCNCLCAEAKLA